MKIQDWLAPALAFIVLVLFVISVIVSMLHGDSMLIGGRVVTCRTEVISGNECVVCAGRTGPPAISCKERR